MTEATPYREFLQITSFVASIGIALALSAAQTLANSTSFMGRTDSITLNAVNEAARQFTWSTSMFSISLILSMEAQLLLTSTRFRAVFLKFPKGPEAEGLSERELHFQKVRTEWMQSTLAGMSWLSLLLATAGLAFVGQGMKPIVKEAGLTLQWALLGFGVPLFVLWVLVASLYEKDRRSGRIIHQGSGVVNKSAEAKE